jgi:uncharacterized membrane protein
VDLYDFLKTLHVLSAAIWFGTAIQQQIQQARAKAANDDQRMLQFMDEAEFFGKRVFAPISGITALFGILLVIQSGWEFADLWIIIGIVLWVASVAIGAGYLNPQTIRLKQLASERGVGDPEVQKRIAAITTVVRVDAVILTLVIADMVIKPGA